MSILGHGVDLVAVARIEETLARRGERFRARVFTPAEDAYCAAMREPAAHYAARWAAKEAVAKALGCGIGAGAGFTDIEVGRDEATGRPFLRLHADAAATARAMGVRATHLSLSHHGGLALASVILEGESPTANR